MKVHITRELTHSIWNDLDEKSWLNVLNSLSNKESIQSLMDDVTKRYLVSRVDSYIQNDVPFPEDVDGFYKELNSQIVR